MSANDRQARGFPAFAARRGGRVRGQSWWGKAWADALEDTSLDEDALKRGRSYARTGQLGPITVSPGELSTTGYEDGSPFRTVLTLHELDDAAWESLWEKTAALPEVADGLLAGELPPDLMEAAEDARVSLLPGYGDLEADCDCDSFEYVCTHAAALSYQASWLLDEDPFLLLLLRGRSEQEAQEELRSVVLMAAIAGGLGGGGTQPEPQPAPVPLPEGIPAADLFGRTPAALPALPPLPAPPVVANASSAQIGTDPLERLIHGAALRGRELLAYTHGLTPEPPAPLDLWRDCVRIAATRPDSQVLARLREASGNSQKLERAAEAWRLGGGTGLDVLEEAWTPSRQDTARARHALTAGWEQDELSELDVHDNHWTLTGRGLQLRYGRDGRWYPYRQTEDGRWWPAAAPHEDPADALADLLDG
ncbi:SWIM zinc finger family protein [Streptomyces diastaticus]|uniref:SWIM zinc finger family protein n=1 Tax=Streptomyces diastaticus TaxID=1956 RepID=UPI003807C1DC